MRMKNSDRGSAANELDNSLRHRENLAAFSFFLRSDHCQAGTSMFTRLRNLLFGTPQSEQDRITRMLNQLKRDVEAGPEQMPLDSLRPVLIPSSIFESGGWPGPHHHFPKLPVSLTWAFLRPENTMLYLFDEPAGKLTADGMDWRDSARKAALSDFERQPWTFEYRNRDGTIGAVALNHEDGLGPSRLFCYRQLLERFPDGFQLFVPERNITFLQLPTASPGVRAELERVIRDVHANAGVPMSLEPHDHQLLKEALIAAGECT
jgi:hypothetical protein